MSLPSALHLALDLARSPILAAAMRRQPVPRDVLILIQLASADTETLARLSRRTNRNGSPLRAAAVLYLQRVLWGPDSDHYRALGVDPRDPPEKLKQHFSWLMKWLHPDKAQTAEEAVFREKVLAAWDALKTPERRLAYDRTLRARPDSNRRRSRLPWIEVPARKSSAGWPRWWRFIPALAALAALVAWTASINRAVPQANPVSITAPGAMLDQNPQEDLRGEPRSTRAE